MTRELDEYRVEVQKPFEDFLVGFSAAVRIAILYHSDVDGLTAGCSRERLRGLGSSLASTRPAKVKTPGLQPASSGVAVRALLAYWCCNFVQPVEDLDWIAALSMLADNAESAGFAELSAAKRRYGAAELRKAASLLNAARRSSSGDAGPALSLLVCVWPKGYYVGFICRSRKAEACATGGTA